MLIFATLRENQAYDTQDQNKTYYGKNLQFGSKGFVYIDDPGFDCTFKPCKKEGNWQYCTPKNCSQHFWTKKVVIGDEAYFTLEAHDVKPGKLQQMRCF